MMEILKNRRSIRKYVDKKVEKKIIDEIIKTALISPSSRSRRPWQFVVIDDKAVLEKLSVSREHGSAFIKDAPLAFIVLADKEICDVWIEDASIAAIMIQVAAQAAGIGTCWVQVRDRYKDGSISTDNYIKELLNIPDNFAVECIISAGYPGEEKTPYDEETLPYEKVHYNRFGK